MSTFTTQVRWIVENNSQPGTITQRCAEAAPKIFTFDFPFWKDDKTEFEAKILRHYYLKEICGETVGQWKLFLEDRLNMIMPYYVELYNTTTQEIDYLNDVNITETYSDKASFEASSTSDETGQGTRLDSDLPQATLNGTDYGTESSETETSSTSNANSETTSTSEFTRIRHGANGGITQTKMLLEYRQAIINIEQMIINELSDLFFGIYDSHWD